MEPVNRLLKQAHGNRFRPGVSGNPKGRPKGVPNRATTMVQKILDGKAKDLVDALVKQALKGDVTALRLCLDRIVAPVRERAIAVPIPAPTSAGEIAEALRVVFGASTSGGLMPGEAQTLAALLESQRKAIETAVLEARVAAVESALDQKDKGSVARDAVWLDRK